MKADIGKFLQMAINTGIIPKDALNNVAPAVGHYLVQWMKSQKLTTELQPEERELAYLLLEKDNDIILAPCLLADHNGRDLVNRVLLSKGVNLTGLLGDLPVLDLITTAINEKDNVRAMQTLTRFIRQASENNRLEAPEPEPEIEMPQPLAPRILPEDDAPDFDFRDFKEEEDIEEEQE